MHQVILLLAITLAGSAPKPTPKPECKTQTTIVANPDGTTTIRTHTACVQEGK